MSAPDWSCSASWSVHWPAGSAHLLLVFLAIGMLVGQDGPGGLEFNDFNLAYDVGSIALALILLAGGLGTRVADIQVCWGPALTLATLGVILTAGVVGAAVWLFDVSLPVALFGGVQLIGGSGYLAVYLCGVLLMHPLGGERRHELDVTHGGLAWLSQILMFLMMGLLVTPHQLTGEVVAAAGVALVLIFVARPLAVAIGLAPFRFTLRERLFIAWVGLRGAVPIFLAIIPVASPGPIDVNFFNVVFMVVIASLVLQGWTIPWLARRLDLESKGEAPA